MDSAAVPMRDASFVIDTNVLITLEQLGAPSEPFSLAARFARLVQQGRHGLWVHPATRRDFQNDPDDERRRRRLSALEKYQLLPTLPRSPRLQVAFATADPNDAVDGEICAALETNAATFFVTEDRPLHSRLARFAPDLAERTLLLDAAVQILETLHPAPGTPPPRVDRRTCIQLDLADPIFESIRTDYVGFDQWFAKCQKEHRSALVVERLSSGGLEAVCILKEETDHEYELPSPRLKICTLKVAEEGRGQRLGELLIRAVLDEAIASDQEGLSVTVFEKQVELIGLLRDLGFLEVSARTDADELVMWRPVKPPPDGAPELNAFEYHRRYGPSEVRLEVPVHVVPIQPHWDDELFPDGRKRDPLFALSPSGNGLRKAYLSHAGHRQLRPGDILLFYRSGDCQRVRFVGVVEDTFASRDGAAIVSHVGTRTVYSAQEIASLTENGSREVLVIRFRQAVRVRPGWTLSQLISARVLQAAPQSVQTVPHIGAQWVRQHLGA